MALEGVRRAAASLCRPSITRTFAVVALLSVAALVVLALSAIHFAQSTSQLAQHLRDDGFNGAQQTSRLSLLLEQHRRIVRSVPAEPNRERLFETARALEALNQELDTYLRELEIGIGASSDGIIWRLRQDLPALCDSAFGVVLFTETPTRNRSLEASQADYEQAADRMSRTLAAWHRERLATADLQLSALLESARGTIHAALISGVIALLLIGPIGMTITGRVVARLRSLTRTMSALAASDTAVAVPSQGDPDEVGDMARAVAVFKRNALDLAQRTAELQRFRDAIDTTGFMVSIWDDDDRLVLRNAAYRASFRFGDRDLPADIVLEGKTHREVMELRVRYGLHTEHVDEPQRFVEERTQRRQREEDHVIELMDGRAMRVTYRRLPDGGRVVVGADITEIKEAEARAREAERQLHHSQKLEALGTLAGGIAHDLNNTLVPVLALTKLTLGRLAPESRERANLQTVLQASYRARDLVKQILAFSRKEALEPAIFDLSVVGAETLAMLRASIPSTITLNYDAKQAAWLLGDAGQLQQVIVNLVANAAQAVGAGAGTITLTIAVAPDPAGDEIVMTVEDTGCGMDDATLRRIFEPFFTTKGVNEGTGLGLSIVYGIITAHKGRIDATSDVGRGTRLTIHLPGAKMAVAPVPDAEIAA
jgi:signal transduction histidine kinase